jgi:hypothetical protein
MRGFVAWCVLAALAVAAFVGPIALSGFGIRFAI